MPVTATEDVVVGAGIIGLATAWHLARGGRRVVVVERHQRAHGASVRNFGMVWPIGQPRGSRQALALRSREHWLSILPSAGLWHELTGSLHVAYHDDEMAVLSEFIDDGRGALECRLMTAREVAATAPRVRTAGLKGALWSPHEIVA